MHDSISISEENGLNLLTDEDLKVYSVGISTAGSAEKMMVLGHPTRQVIATTIDPKGKDFAEEIFQKAGLAERVQVKLEDVSKSLVYEDESFDFIYARLVLHYLSKSSLDGALHELYRVLKKGGKLFVVVRSIFCEEIKEHYVAYDDATCMTTYESNGKLIQRYFHTLDSISSHLRKARFKLLSTSIYDEKLCSDFFRKIPSKYRDNLIEVVSEKV